MNRSEFIGRLSSDPEEKTFGDTTVVNFILAVDNPFAKKNKNLKSFFFEIEAWGKLATICLKWLKKGTKIYADCYAKPNVYKSGDTLVRNVHFVLQSFEFCESKTSQSNTGAIMGEMAGNGDVNEHGNKNAPPIDFGFDDVSVVLGDDFGEMPFA